LDIEEIARKANLSRSTVSRVINNHPSVRDETRAAVLKVIEEMGYFPNAAARSLKSRRSSTIGVLVYNIAQPFWAGIFSGIEDGVSDSGYGLILSNSKSHLDVHDFRNEYRKNLRNLVQRGVDGIVIALANNLKTEDVDFLESSGIPFVIVQNHLDDPRVSSVNVNNVTGARRAAEHLIGLGHERIVHAAGPLDSGIYQDRMKGFLDAMEGASLPVTGDSVMQCGSLFGDGYWFMKRLISQNAGVTAVVMVNDVSAYGACLAAREEGVSIPGDLSIVGFDWLPRHLDIARLLPDLTTMHQPAGDIGAAAVRMLLRKLGGDNVPEQEEFELELHEGATCRRIGE